MGRGFALSARSGGGVQLNCGGGAALCCARAIPSHSVAGGALWALVCCAVYAFAAESCASSTTSCQYYLAAPRLVQAVSARWRSLSSPTSRAT